MVNCIARDFSAGGRESAYILKVSRKTKSLYSDGNVFGKKKKKIEKN